MNNDEIKDFYKGKEILITGGTGSLGNILARKLLSEYKPKGIRIFSRDENKQFNMKHALELEGFISGYDFLLGDVRDEYRLELACKKVDYVIHAAAIKQIPIAETNPLECIKTNINGTTNVLRACLSQKIKKAILISSDKAVEAANLYGATKKIGECLFIQGNIYSGLKGTKFSVVRYGNVIGSRGSFIPIIKKCIKNNKTIPITHFEMTRFWITLNQAADLVLKCLAISKGGEIFVPKLPSTLIKDIIYALDQNAQLIEIGIRKGEKLHECLISNEELRHLKHYDDNLFIIAPNILDPYNYNDFKKYLSSDCLIHYPGLDDEQILKLINEK